MTLDCPDELDLIIAQKAQAKADAVVRLLMDWADWQKGYRMKIGYPRRSAGMSSGGVVSEQSSDDYTSSDNIRCEIVDGCVDGLIPVQKAAIYHRYLAAVFRMRDYEHSLLHAHEQLTHTLRVKGVLW